LKQSCIRRKPLKMVVLMRHVGDNLNKIVKNYWNRVALDGNSWTWSNICNRMQTPKSKASNVNFWCIFLLKMVIWPKHVGDNLNKIVNSYWNRVALDGNYWTWLCMKLNCIQFQGNTRAYSRSGQWLAAFQSVLPGGHHNEPKACTILDCIWSSNNRSYYILDILAWNNQPLLDCEVWKRHFHFVFPSFMRLVNV
jgi:hypothetical protein